MEKYKKRNLELFFEVLKTLRKAKTLNMKQTINEEGDVLKKIMNGLSWMDGILLRTVKRGKQVRKTRYDERRH